MRYLKLIILMLFILSLSPAVFAQMPLVPVGHVNIGPPWFEGMEVGYTSTSIDAFNYYGDYWFEVTAIPPGVLDEDNVIYTSKIGNDADAGDTPYESKLTIQAAITQALADGAAVDNEFAVYVYPGVYVEALVMGDYVNLIGLGTLGSVQVTGINENALVTMSNVSSNIYNIAIIMAPTAVNATAIEAPDGIHYFRNVVVNITSATNGIECRVLNMDDGEVYIDHSFFEYDLSGSAAGALVHQIFDVAGTSILCFGNSNITATINDVDDLAVVIEEAAGAVIGETVCTNNTIHMHLDNAAYAGLAGIYYAHGNGLDKRWENNHMHLSCDGNGTGYGYVMNTNTGGIIYSTGNYIEVTGFTNNWYANIAVNDELHSGFDTVTAVSGWGGAGTFVLDFANAHGEHYINGAFQLEDGSEAAGNLLTSDATGGGTWQAPGAIPGIWLQMAETNVIVEGAQYTAIIGTPVGPGPGIENVVVIVMCREPNSGVMWPAFGSPCPVASFLTYYIIENGLGNIEIHITNSTQADALCTVSYTVI